MPRLCITRRAKESFLLRFPGQPEVRITLNEIRGHRAGLSIEAPASVEIQREELSRPKKPAA